MNAQEWALLITLSLVWGGSFFFIAIAVKALPPLTIVLLRVAIGALALGLLLAALGQKLPLHATALRTFLGMGILNNVVPQSLIVWAQGSLPGGYASILNATTPFFTVLILHLATSDKATPLRFAGVFIGLFGVAAMMGLDLIAHAGGSFLPQFALLVASFSYGLSNLWGRRVAGLGIPPVAAATGQLLSATLVLAPLAFLVERPLALPMPAPGVWLAILALALISTAFAYILFFRILATAGPSNLSLVTFLIPISAILLGVLFLGEQIHPRHYLGLALIGIGLACIDGRPVQRLRGHLSRA